MSDSLINIPAQDSFSCSVNRWMQGDRRPVDGTIGRESCLCPSSPLIMRRVSLFLFFLPKPSVVDVKSVHLWCQLGADIFKFLAWDPRLENKSWESNSCCFFFFFFFPTQTKAKDPLEADTPFRGGCKMKRVQRNESVFLLTPDNLSLQAKESPRERLSLMVPCLSQFRFKDRGSVSA